MSVVEDYLSFEQLRDVRLNVAVVRPLVDRLYDPSDISIVYCLLVNRAQFLHEQSHLNNRQNVNFGRATLCEFVATRILRRFSEDSNGPEGLLLLANVLVAGFVPFQNAPDQIREEALATADWTYHRTLPSLEIAILTESKQFLSGPPCQRVIDAIYEGKITYTPSSYINIIPDHYKHQPISIYDPRKGPMLNQYRLMVPRTRNILDVMGFVILLLLYVAVMAKRDPAGSGPLEACFAVYTFGWSLDQFATIMAHGWRVYSRNLWSFLDICFVGIYLGYAALRVHGARVGDMAFKQQALDILAMGAPVLVPRLAFNLLSDNLVFLSLRSMMPNFFLLTLLSVWCFAGFLLSLLWLGEGGHSPVDIGKWMLWIWFGLDGTGIGNSARFHWLLGPVLMVAFAFLGNTLFLTILVSMLSNTFGKIASNAAAEVQFRRAVLTLEGVKSDAVFSYQPPFNILAVFLLVPLKFIVSPRWFHKINVATVRLVNLPLLLVIAMTERRVLWPTESPQKPASPGGILTQIRQWFWVNWRITTHRDIRAVFDLPPPQSVGQDVAADDDVTDLIQRQFAAQRITDVSASAESSAKTPTRRDSMFPRVNHGFEGSFTKTDDLHGIHEKMEVVEASLARVESMLARLWGKETDKD
ncbi:hypothetical protein ACRALDRAFT_1063531 [Sodiomyces alcalophilus JCM 7366]|uniref:uncharacterized protein n=1 Tax=Sodiomyces alcalophilus JCM 7366 TaxID=591952 RepID=UPI0039B4C718